MSKLLAIVFAIIFPASVWSHSGVDPLDEYQKNRSRIAIKQMTFFQLDSREEKIDSLESQIDYLRKNLLILQNIMAKDYPHVKEGMSKYKIDYIEVLDDSLKKLRLSVKQAGLLIDQ
ncbi:hypothetical protein O0V09_18920 [Dasania sp. GY-19]|uniref:Uncharacterized protein n=1 Tax=Dasania phycosphaerae TaxID=2950436 RepID=A0A9J6RSM7_9GAMM|nr:hypothetical protein [Dasania phycosphaerae]MCZ0867273.1 hypothetical protein [Dasania phycosphaerae]